MRNPFFCPQFFCLHVFPQISSELANQLDYCSVEEFEGARSGNGETHQKVSASWPAKLCVPPQCYLPTSSRSAKLSLTQRT